MLFLTLIVNSSVYIRLFMFRCLFCLITQYRGMFGCISSFVFTDKLSFLLVLLTVWFCVVLLVCSVKYLSVEYQKLLIMLRVLVVCSFIRIDFLGFYIFFEFSLIPLIIIILGWGYQIERVRAIYYLILYTLIGSFPLLLGIFFIYQFNSNVCWVLFTKLNIGSFELLVFSIILLISFFIKLPIYLCHLWLPKAHVEAPAIGSIFLAAILLKLRAYGIYRVILLLSIFINLSFNLFSIFLVYGGLMRSLVCIFQSDIKSLIAYSSISHMGGLMCGLISQVELAMLGVWVVIVSHAFCSSGLFFASNLNYEQECSRQMLILRGQGGKFYYFRIIWRLLLLVNFAVPPFLRVLGELNILIGLFWLNYFFFFFLGSTILAVSLFCVYIFRVIIHGSSMFNKVLLGEYDLSFLISFIHLIPLFMLSFFLCLFFYLNSLIIQNKELWFLR